MKRWVDKYYHRLEITAFPVLGIVSTITNICRAGIVRVYWKTATDGTDSLFSSLAVAKKDVSFVSRRFSTSC